MDELSPEGIPRCASKDNSESSVYVPLCVLDYLPNTFECPVNLLAGDDQRRGQTDYSFVRFFAENPQLFHRLAVRPGRAAHFHAHPPPAPAHVAHVGAA